MTFSAHKCPLKKGTLKKKTVKTERKREKSWKNLKPLQARRPITKDTTFALEVKSRVLSILEKRKQRKNRYLKDEYPEIQSPLVTVYIFWCVPTSAVSCTSNQCYPLETWLASKIKKKVVDPEALVIRKIVICWGSIWSFFSKIHKLHKKRNRVRTIIELPRQEATPERE